MRWRRFTRSDVNVNDRYVRAGQQLASGAIDWVLVEQCLADALLRLPRTASWTKSADRAISARWTLPRVQPIIATRRKEPFDDPDWLFDFKYDGFRALCYIEQGRCRFISRNGNVLSRFEALGEQVAAVLDVDDAIIDGEVIAADETGRPQFYELLRVPRSASYVAFDILWLNGTDLRALPLTERRKSLQGIVSKGSPIVSEALSGRELFELMCANDLEGIVAKRLADPYGGRIRWLKIKTPTTRRKRGEATCSTGRGSGLRVRQASGRDQTLGSVSERRLSTEGV
jgi:ATP-dependent DNA ligase